MQEMLYPTSYIKSRHLAKECALVTDGRFSGGTSGLSIGHVSPEAAEGGAIGLLKDGDVIAIDIAARSISVDLPAAELDKRRAAEASRGAAAFTPRGRKREISEALKIYALLASSADTGAVRKTAGAVAAELAKTANVAAPARKASRKTAPPKAKKPAPKKPAPKTAAPKVKAKKPAAKKRPAASARKKK